MPNESVNSQSQSATEQKIKILIADDQDINLTLITRCLDSDLYENITAQNGKIALKLTEEHDFDLIILDVMMPEMSGFDVCRKLKENPKTKQIPVIFLTANTSIANINEGFKAGAVDYIKKPFNTDELRHRVYTQLKLINYTKKLENFNQLLHQVEKKLWKYIDIVNQHVISSNCDQQRTISYISDAFIHAANLEPEEILGKPFLSIFHPDTDPEILKEIQNSLESNNKWEGEVCFHPNISEDFWTYTYFFPAFNEDGLADGMTAIHHDITDKKKLEQISITDELTKLYNRRYFNLIFDKEFQRAKRDNKFFAFFMLDLDHFKGYNDTYGHHMGDNVLFSVSNALKSNLKRAGDIIFRLGGEEFGGILTVHHKEDALSLAEHIRKSVMDLNIEHKANPPYLVVTSSIGLYVVSDFKDDAKEIYVKADNALYKAKSNGRNQVVVDYD